MRELPPGMMNPAWCFTETFEDNGAHYELFFGIKFDMKNFRLMASMRPFHSRVNVGHGSIPANSGVWGSWEKLQGFDLMWSDIREYARGGADKLFELSLYSSGYYGSWRDNNHLRIEFNRSGIRFFCHRCNIRHALDYSELLVLMAQTPVFGQKLCKDLVDALVDGGQQEYADLLPGYTSFSPPDGVHRSGSIHEGTDILLPHPEDEPEDTWCSITQTFTTAEKAERNKRELVWCDITSEYVAPEVATFNKINSTFGSINEAQLRTHDRIRDTEQDFQQQHHAMLQAIQGQQELLRLQQESLLQQRNEIDSLKSTVRDEVREKLEAQYREELEEKERNERSLRGRLRRLRRETKDRVRQRLEHTHSVAQEANTALVKAVEQKEKYWSVKGALHKAKSVGAKAAVELTIASIPFMLRMMGGGGD